ncbi:unnamed protein product [Linum tenue]|uniref:Uncharacterized protein n=1 Tax=Linum tenue TaxID=586396 RepID=A0AAV0QRG1_9ROSI|nr:unnamed protein product [Linum tenue]
MRRGCSFNSLFTSKFLVRLLLPELPPLKFHGSGVFYSGGGAKFSTLMIDSANVRLGSVEAAYLARSEQRSRSPAVVAHSPPLLQVPLHPLANQFCGSIGLKKPPSMFRRSALKLGLKDIPLESGFDSRKGKLN